MIRAYFSQEDIDKADTYVSSISANASCQYYPFEIGSPNFMKHNNLDRRSVVKGCFYQYNFFPWNVESNILYQILSPLIIHYLELTNQICMTTLGKSHQSITGLHPNSLYSASHFLRLAYQCFPYRTGFLAIHRDPVGSHQICAPILSLNRPKEHGLYYINNNSKIDLQPLLEYGDVVFFDSSKLHAVEHDLSSDQSTRHILLSCHAYHHNRDFLQSTVR
jgi:hypothetical protein